MTERAKTGARTKKRDGGGGEKELSVFGHFLIRHLSFLDARRTFTASRETPDRYATDTSCEQLLQVTDINSVMTS